MDDITHKVIAWVQHLCDQDTHNTIAQEPSIEDDVIAHGTALTTSSLPLSLDHQSPVDNEHTSDPLIWEEGDEVAPPGQLLALHPDDPVTFTDDGTLDSHEVGFDAMLEGTDLTPEDRQRVIQFLQLNADVFCWEPNQLGCCTLGYHTIDTGDAPPVRQTYYRMPYKKHEQMQATCSPIT